MGNNIFSKRTLPIIREAFFFLFILFLIPLNSYADKIRIKTYIPSPDAVYDRLRLMPHAWDQNECKLGPSSTAKDANGNLLYPPCATKTLFINSADNNLWTCDQCDAGKLGQIWSQNGSGDLFLKNSISNTTVSKTQNLGIGVGTTTIAPTRLYIENGGLLAKGSLNSGNPLNGTSLCSSGKICGEGIKFFWYPDKASIRAGEVLKTYFSSWSEINDYTNTDFFWDDKFQGINGITDISTIYSYGFGLNAMPGGEYATVLGGSHNLIYPKTSNYAQYGTIGGGGGLTTDDTTKTSQSYASLDFMSSDAGLATRLQGNSIHPNAGRQPNYSTIGGGSNNIIEHDYGFIGGGFLNILYDSNSSILGGRSNVINASKSVIGGGYGNATNGPANTIVGGSINSGMNNNSTVISGSNQISNDNSVILAGSNNFIASSATAGIIAQGTSNPIYVDYSVILNGNQNRIDEATSVIASGSANKIPTSNNTGSVASILNGNSNYVYSQWGVIADGNNNINDGTLSGIFGGQNNATWGVSSGSAIGGGSNNTLGKGDMGATPPNILIDAQYSMIPGGYGNINESNYGFVGGRNMQILKNLDPERTRNFLWGHRTAPNADSQLQSNNRFIVMSSVAGIGVLNPDPALGRLQIDGSVKVINGNVIVAMGNTIMAGSKSPLYIDNSNNIGCNGCDLAETFPTKDEIEAGDLLIQDNSSELNLIKSQTPYDSKIVGIASSAPAITFEESRLKAAPIPMQFTKGKNPPVALVGRVLCKVSLENGAIETGDLLTSSSTPGYAMKATDLNKAYDSIVAKALEPFNGGKDHASTGQISVMVLR